MSLEKEVCKKTIPWGDRNSTRKRCIALLKSKIEKDCIKDKLPVIYSKSDLKKEFYKCEFMENVEVSALNSAYTGIVLIPLIIVKFLFKNESRKFDINEILDGINKDSKIDLEEWKPHIIHKFSLYPLEKDNDIVKLFSTSNLYMYSPRCATILKNKFIKRKGICYESDCNAGRCPNYKLK